MALSEESGMVMPVSPMYGNGGFGNGFGGDGWWILLLLLFASNGGWGGFGGFGGLGMMGMADGMMLYPWMNQAEITTGGFQNAATNQAIASLQNSVTSGFGDVQNALCSGFAGVNAGVANGFAQAEISNNARQIANMQTAYAGQTAMAQGFNNLASQFADCCCEQRLSNCQLSNTVQNEANATRFADANNTRDLLTAFNSGIQSLKDQLCDYRNEQKDDTIAQLRSELLYARGQASQDVQTAAIQAGQRALANEVEQYVLPTPRPAYIVQNPNCCAPTACGCGGF